MKFVSFLLKFTSGFLIFLVAIPSEGQQRPPVIDVSKIILSDTFNTECWFYTADLDSVNDRQLTSLAFKPKITKNNFKTISTNDVDKDWYINFCLQNPGDTSITLFFYPGIYLSRIDLYVYNDVSKNADPIPTVLPNDPDFADSIGYRSITVPAHSQKMYYASLRFVKTDVNTLEIRFVRDYYLSIFARNFKLSLTNNKMYYYIITGILLMMIFYSMAVFILNGSFEFMYYACFAFSMGLLFFLKAYYYKTPESFTNYFESYLDFIIQCLGFFFYSIFLRKFLDTKKNFPLLTINFFLAITDLLFFLNLLLTIL